MDIKLFATIIISISLIFSSMPVYLSSPVTNTKTEIKRDIKAVIIWQVGNKTIDLEKNNVTINDIKNLKEDILGLGKRLSGIKKIEQQLKLIDRTCNLSTYSFYETLKLIAHELDKDYYSSLYSINNFLFFYGPTIISHFTVDTRIKGVSSSLKQRWYSQIYNMSHVKGVTGFLPSYIGFCSENVYVTAINFPLEKSCELEYKNFLEILYPCLGISIGFEKEEGEILFEYNLDLSLKGMTTGIRKKTFSL